MRIGVNTLPLFPGQIGGMETYTVNLLTHLAAHDISTATTSTSRATTDICSMHILSSPMSVKSTY